MDSFSRGLLISIGVLMVVTGCTGTPLRTQNDISPPIRATRVQASYFPSIFNLAQGLASQLNANYRQGSLASCTCVITTFVDIDDLSKSSEFGRLLSEALGAEMFRHGGSILDIRQARTIMAKPGTGELILSRYAEDLPGDVSTNTVMVGTYGIGHSSVAVTAKIIDINTRKVLSVAMAEIARTPGIDTLLNSSSGPEPTAYDRMP